MKLFATERRQIVVPQLLVIGYGNSLRRDDGAGWVLTERLVNCWAEQFLDATYPPAAILQLRTDIQLLPEMALEIGGQMGDGPVAAVIFVDSTVDSAVDSTGANADRTGHQPQIQVTRLAPATPSPSLGHHLDPATLLNYVQALYDQSPAAWLVTIPGTDFELGEGFSPQVAALLDDAPKVAARLWQEIEVELLCTS